ncbi:MAG: NAD(P)(+) transhydrogenase (Re/Si-specific) subunit alpha, partial [Pseudomonadota bacterium]|nr:NAD(P)(+) transhydrogenase (Re/Si-specific) subunit alpha [Pseudomonadota bacterium]
APKLLSRDMVASMADGSVIVDLAVERGGNVEGAIPGQVAKVGGVTIIGHMNMAGRIAASSSALLARNIFAFVEPMIDKATNELKINRDDEIVAATLLTSGGAIVHPAFAPKQDAAASVQGGGTL